jgi:hypothetical protein
MGIGHRASNPIQTMEMNIATWNVRSMFQAGKMEEIANELKRYTNNSITGSEIAHYQIVD